MGEKRNETMDPLYSGPAEGLDGHLQRANFSWAFNNSENTTGFMPPGPVSAVRTVIIPIIYLLVCIFGLSGNALVIYVVLRYAKMKTVTNIYILNLAVADVLLMLGLPFIATQNAISYWPFGAFLCRLVMTVDGINQFTSTFCLTVMSMDRYLAVVHPIKSTKWRRPRVARLISAAVWTFSLLMSLPVIIFADVQEDWNTCNISWPEPVNIWAAVFIIYTSVLGFFGPLLVICLCYLLIVIKVKSSGVRVGSTRRRRSERKVTRMVVIIVVVFVFCWLPFFTLNIVNLVFILPEEAASAGVYFFVVILSYANSCANPILYGFLSDNFKQSFQKVLCLRKGYGVEDGDPTDHRLEKSSRLQEAMLSSRNTEFNGHMQTSKVGDHKFSAHRIVLAASIPYFHAMFTNDMMECKQDEIVMQGMDPSALEALINFAYNGHLAIDQQNVQSLLMGASFLQLQNIKDACCTFLRERLHPKNCLGVRQFAETMMCAVLYDSANSFIHQHFVEVSMSEEFLALPFDDVLELVSRDELNVKSEEQVFEAALAWIRYDQEQREPCLPELLSKIRLPLCRPQFLSDRVQQDDLVRCCHKCRDLVDEAKDYHLMPERRPHLLAFKTRPRCCTSIAGLIYAVGGLNSAGDSLNVVEVFDPIANRWEKCQPMTTARSRVGVAVVNGLLYAIGGYDGQLRLSTVEVYNPETDTWTKVGSMNSKRSAMGTVVLDGQIYVCGGYDGNSSLNSVETYSPETDKWTIVTPMSSNRSAAGVTVFEGRIYVSGGHDGLQIFNSVEYYNHHTATWHPVASMLNKRCRHGAASLGSKMFVCGGYDGSGFLSIAEVYSSVADQWYLIVPMNTRRSRVSLVANCGRLYAVGGYDGQSNLSSVEMYDPETNRWTFMAPMVCHEGGVGVGCIPLLTI